ncbi:hypothetical protein ACU4GH_39880 [Bradyrhizobium betae]
MKLGRLIRSVLATLVVAGLALAPLAGPAAALRTSMPGMSMAQSGDMPCCPDKQKSDDCKDCPLLALCMLKNVMADAAAAATVVRTAVHTTRLVFDDTAADGLDRPPPDHPPRTLV